MMRLMEVKWKLPTTLDGWLINPQLEVMTRRVFQTLFSTFFIINIKINCIQIQILFLKFFLFYFNVIVEN